ncbi:hypothetical protein HZZ00_11145 [Streptomyces sp. NEAU-sy36]|uniref:DUF6197 family protein n=1 Tax=unclassified Streptomyces TaxID=2593676 RepID=UPI0015D604E1|nr:MULTISPECIES: hypothetical protein [unclassified Streptomyces]QLJ01527.1 hypothetical protein HZZ00_11145 [Streptomyces sp. NEAU-sy36]
MTTTIAPAATRPATLTLDDRLALASLDMDDRLNKAGVAVDINTAHIDIDAGLPAAPPPQTVEPNPHSTPIAQLLHRARVRLQADGWCRGALREDGRRCAIGAIRIEAATRSQADDASALLLEVVRRDFGGDTVPSWNDSQNSPRPVLLALDRTAQLAHNRNL